MKLKKIIRSNGTIIYRLSNGVIHRKNGPALSNPNGHQEWWRNGNLHRLDGPARTYSNGIISYWVDGEHLSEYEFRNHPKVMQYRYIEERHQYVRNLPFKEYLEYLFDG